MDIIDQANALLEQVDAAHQAGQLPRAQRLTERALAMLEAELGARDPNLAPVLSTLGRLRAARGDDPGAAAHFTRAVALLRRVAEPEAKAIEIDTRRSLGLLRIRAAAYPAARRELERALALAESTFGKQHLEVALTLNALGMLGKYTARFAEANRHYQRALRIVLREAGADSEEAAVLYHNLGGLEHARGAFAKGEAYARRGVDVRQRLFGPDHPAVAEDVAALAALLDGQSKFAESEPMYERVLAIFRARRAHYDVAVNLHNLAAAHAEQGKLASAAKMYREAERLKRKLLGDDHPDTALTSFALGMLARDRGDAAEAARRVESAHRVFRKSLGPRHPHTVEAGRALGKLTKR